MNNKFCQVILVVLGLVIVKTGYSQDTTTATAPTGIEIVAQLEKPKNDQKFDEKDLGGYLLVYFKDQNQSAYMAISSDGYTFTDINNGNPIFIGSELAEQKGVRDPHITRGPDGAFYLAMTDLHIFGKRAGFRETDWERPLEKYGWGNNRALVLMKSYDLIHWTHSDFRVDTAFPELGDIDCSWAPQTIYDPEKKKMMVYFTIRYNNKDANIYYSYTNDAFTKLETTPKLVTAIGGIDADITKVGDKYQMFYVAGAKIKHAVSDKINQDFTGQDKRIDPEEVNTEAPNVFKRIGTDTYVLMYDVYGLRPSNMGFSETKDFVTYQDIGHFNKGVMKTTNFTSPKHGAVTYLTKQELKAIADHWKIDN
ncbi:glycoside hydrolase family 43 protein [Confluentibacter citreus]|uniref:glycoside hydrolase family 43 protein n=1 Tax=Confluentibacter citreus TaxID=2007307 RepID=UPI000C28855E|nr:glycoside hydrolase family 43 protein [Confluentibacter citreus]